MIYNENAKWGRNRDRRKALVSYIINTYGTIVSRKQLLSLISSGKCEYNELTWIFVNKEFKAQRGQYNFSCMIDPTPMVNELTTNENISSSAIDMNVIL
jgi:hypothetical protein